MGSRREEPPFAGRVAEGMARRGFTLRSFCRAVGLDPSFFSKVLSGKRSPPSEEEVLRRIAGALDLDAAELIVSAGRIPTEWEALWRDQALFESVHSLASGTRAASRAAAPRAPAWSVPAARKSPPRSFPAAVRQDLSEELL